MTATPPYSSQAHKPMSRLRKCFYLACLLAACLLLAEIAARIVLAVRPLKSDAQAINANILRAYPAVPLERILEQSAGLRLQFDPYLVMRMQPGQQTECYTINAQGFRGKAPQTPKPEGVCRVVVMGGSVAFGYLSSSDEAALPAQLERALQQELGETRVEVFNGGVIGYNSGQELILYTQRLRAWQADVIVVVNGFNDLFNYASSGKVGWPAHADYLASHLRQIQTFKRERPFPWEALKEFAVERSALLKSLRHLRSRAAQAPPRAVDTSAEALERVADFYGNNMRQLAALALQDGARMALVLQPVNGLAAKAYTQYEKDSVGVMERYFTNYPDFMRAGRAALAQRMAALQQQTQAVFIDSGAFFDEVPQGIYYDICHVTDEGNALLARKLARALIAAGLLAEK